MIFLSFTSLVHTTSSFSSVNEKPRLGCGKSDRDISFLLHTVSAVGGACSVGTESD